MTSNTESLTSLIGTRVRNERTGRGWTLDTLATAAGLSRRMLVNVEQGAVNPSIGTLLRLSEALGIGLPALVEPPSPSGVKVTRDGEGAVLWEGAHGGTGVLVAGNASPDAFELWEWTLYPSEIHKSEAHSPATRELLQVLAGRMLVTVSGDEYYLERGDSLAFFGDVEHSYENTSGTPAQFSLAVFEPGTGSNRSYKAEQ